LATGAEFTVCTSTTSPALLTAPSFTTSCTW
jgi:hypothetical protein